MMPGKAKPAKPVYDPNMYTPPPCLSGQGGLGFRARASGFRLGVKDLLLKGSVKSEHGLDDSSLNHKP